MKRFILATLLLLALLLPANADDHYDIESGPVGYNITSSNTVSLAGVIEDYWRNSGYNVYLHIPSSISGYTVTSVGRNAFHSDFMTYANWWMDKLAGIELPESITSIEYGGFSCNFSLASINIPSNLTYIGEQAFHHCWVLDNIVLPEGLTYIGPGAFSFCYELSSINIPSTVTYIGESGFRDCAISNHLVIPESVTSIDYATFANNIELPSVTLPSTLTYLGDYAFYNCPKLMDVYSYITDPTSWEAWDIFMLDEGDYSGRTLHVPAGTLALYQESEMWYPYFENIVEMGDGPVPGIPGDVDGDGKVGISDVADLIDYLLGNADSSFVVDNADVDGDGNIGIADVADLIDQLLNN